MKRLCTTLMLLAAAWPLAACGGSIASLPPDLRLADAALTRDANAPVALPVRKLSQAEVENFWGEDRLSLIACRADKRALAGFYQDQIDALRKRPK